MRTDSNGNAIFLWTGLQGATWPIWWSTWMVSIPFPRIWLHAFAYSQCITLVYRASGSWQGKKPKEYFWTLACASKIAELKCITKGRKSNSVTSDGLRFELWSIQYIPGYPCRDYLVSRLSLPLFRYVHNLAQHLSASLNPFNYSSLKNCRMNFHKIWYWRIFMKKNVE